MPDVEDPRPIAGPILSRLRLDLVEERQRGRREDRLPPRPVAVRGGVVACLDRAHRRASCHGRRRAGGSPPGDRVAERRQGSLHGRRQRRTEVGAGGADAHERSLGAARPAGPPTSPTTCSTGSSCEDRGAAPSPRPTRPPERGTTTAPGSMPIAASARMQAAPDGMSRSASTSSAAAVRTSHRARTSIGEAVQRDRSRPRRRPARARRRR